jgi:hypothetical protein
VARAVLLAGLCLCTAPARAAESSDADRATARALAEEGNKALNAKNYALAEDRFRRADALVHAPSLVVDHARALVGLGRLAEAYARYDSARSEPLAPGAPAAFRRAVAEAERAVVELAPKIAWLKISVTGPADPLVRLGERELSAAALSAPVPADVGEVVVKVEADGYVSKEASVTLVAKQKAELSVELEPVPVAPEVVAPPPQKHIVHRVAAAPPPPRRNDTLTYVAFGVGGVGLALGAVTGVLFLSEHSKLKSACPTLTSCPSSVHDDLKRYYLYSYTSSISLAVGLAGAGAGVALLLMKPKEAEAPKAAHLTPYVSLGAVGVEGSF